MNKNNVLDMTKGNEVSLLLRFALPMLIGNIFQQFYNIVDSVIVGKFVGPNALGAVGVVGNLNFLFFSLCMGLGAGVGVLISQFFGAGRDEDVKKIIANSIYVTVVAGIIMGMCGVFLAKPILVAMNTPQENMQDALVYMQIVCGTTVIMAGYNTISSILRALGDSKTPLVYLVVACLINIVLDLVFVLVFNMGVAGAAWATVIAQFVSMAGSILSGVRKNPYLRLQKKHMPADRDILQKTFKLGIPIAGQNALIALSCVALQSVVNQFGSTVMAAFTATNRVEQLVQQPFSSLGTAVSTFAGQNVGAGRYDRVSNCCKKSIGIVVAFSLLMIAVMFLFGNGIVSIFVDDPEVIAIGAKGLRITSMMYIFLGLIYVMRGMLNGVGDATFAMVNGIVEVVGRVGFASLLMMIPSIGMWAVWYTNGLTWVITGATNFIRFVKGGWKTKTMVGKE